MGTEFLPQHPLGPGLVNQALWHPGAMQLQLQSRWGGVRCWRHGAGYRCLSVMRQPL
jgi:hypothetical protein